MLTATKAEPPAVLFVLWFKPKGERRWHRGGRYGPRAVSLNAIDSGGDWWISELRDKRLAGEPEGTLFTEERR